MPLVRAAPHCSQMNSSSTWTSVVKIAAGALTCTVFAAGVGYIILKCRRKSECELESCFEISTPYKTSKILPKKENILIIKSVDQWEEIYEQFAADVADYPVIGLDCEWCHKGEHEVALLQLASFSGLCLLIQIFRLQEIPLSLRDLLADKKILKVGVSISNDALKLLSSFGLNTFGCVELGNLADRGRGLAALAEQTVGVKMDKGLVRSSNWEAKELSEEQIIYAATDALIAVRIFTRLVELKLALNRDTRGQSESAMSQKDYWLAVNSMCQGIVDCKVIKHKLHQKKPHSSHNGNQENSAISQQKEPYIMVRKKPQYENCQIQAPDGQLLCTCSSKKAEWYVQKGLAEKIEDDPIVIRLLFEPNGRPLTEQTYYNQKKENKCVVCGRFDSLVRKIIVPHEYRKFFPSVMKDHRSHDVVLLCAPCHLRCDSHDTRLKRELGLKCNAPIDTNVDGLSKYKSNDALVKVKSAARALLYNAEKIPDSRKEDLKDIVKSYYGLNTIEKEVLEMAVNIEPKSLNGEYVPHGLSVVNHVIENEGLLKFERLWREHFISTMQPKFMPALWSVDHAHEALTALGHSLPS